MKKSANGYDLHEKRIPVIQVDHLEFTYVNFW